MKRSASPGVPGGASLCLSALALAVALGGCISGRVLTGYPGYPFARFDTEYPADSAFFALQPVVESEGFPLDYTIREEGFITTRSAEMMGRPVFLNLVVEPLRQDVDSEAPQAGRTRVWVAAYEETVTGAERINPLQGELWEEIMELTARLSSSVDGSAPIGPEPGSGSEGPSGD